MSQYEAQRGSVGWIVVSTANGEVVGQYSKGAVGAANARAAADLLNAPPHEGTKLRAWRTAHHMSQAQLAKQLGISWLTVQRWESGTQGMPPFLFRALNDLDRELASA